MTNMKKMQGATFAFALALTVLTSACAGKPAADPAPTETPAAEPEIVETLSPEEGSEDVAAPEDGTEPETEPEENVAPDVVGRWTDSTSQRATLTVLENGTERDFLVHWSSSYAEAAEWRMTASYDSEAGAWTYTGGVKTNVTWNEDGTETQEELLWEDAEGSFSFDGDALVWTDSREEAAADCRFERYTAPEVPAETLAESWFRAVGGLEKGVAGAGLQERTVARDVAAFAAENDLFNGDRDALKANLLTAWESLSEEEQSAFDANFLDFIKLMDESFADFEAVRGSYADAGAEEDMARLTAQPAVAASWNLLKSYTLTLGNSED